jgi:hypothetical protein
MLADAFKDLLALLSSRWLDFFKALVGLSVLTMAIIQVGKNLFFLRYWFNRRHMMSWLEERAHQAKTNHHRNCSATNAEKKLLHIATGGDTRAFYDTEIDDLCRQWVSAAQFLVDYPAQSPDLFDVLVADAHQGDVKIACEAITHELTTEQRRTLIDAKNRLRALVQRSIEAFRLATSSRWQRELQTASFITSILLALVALLQSDQLRQHKFIVTVVALLAGFLAPVARDIVAALERLRA